ncbi:MAG: hypothetical protein QOD41_4388, partial [Cryptosporangiaceae bacterium]|nr:hypothetical protein [Cryptosporangiaceae bacterium]
FTEQETEQQWDYELLQDGAVSGFVDEAQLESRPPADPRNPL